MMQTTDNTKTHADLPQHELLAERSFWHSLDAKDWLFAALIPLIAAFVQYTCRTEWMYTKSLSCGRA